MSTPQTYKAWPPVNATPGWETRNGVGCDTGCVLALKDGKATFTQCHAHAAAPEMLALLNALDALSTEADAKRAYGALGILGQRARTLIARIENGG